MPLTLTEAQRRALANRIMLQGPKNASPAELAATKRLVEQRLNGIPGDVLFTLDAIRLLADQGNKVAQDLFLDECDRLGFTTRTYH